MQPHDSILDDLLFILRLNFTEFVCLQVLSMVPHAMLLAIKSMIQDSKTHIKFGY